MIEFVTKNDKILRKMILVGLTKAIHFNNMKNHSHPIYTPEHSEWEVLKLGFEYSSLSESLVPLPDRIAHLQQQIK